MVVVGDSGVGKSSLVHLIAHDKTIANPSWTIGSSVELKLHEYKQGTPAERTFFMELWDVGGNKSHTNTRGVFYNPGIHGVILCHDLSNKKSAANLTKWVSELVTAADQQHRGTLSSQSPSRQIPFLIVGTKVDVFMAQSSDSGLPSRRVRGCDSLQDELDADELFVDTNNEAAFSPGSGNAVKLSRFFDRSIERRLNLDGSSTRPSTTQSHHTSSNNQYYLSVANDYQSGSRNMRTMGSGGSGPTHSPPFSERRRVFNYSPNPTLNKGLHSD